MKKYLVLSMLVFSGSNLAMQNSSGITKAELANEVAGCYVAHKRFQTEFFQNGDAEVYKDVVSLLVGSDKLNRTINNATMKQVYQGPVHLSISAKLYAKKYCTDIEQKLAVVMQ